MYTRSAINDLIRFDFVSKIMYNLRSEKLYINLSACQFYNIFPLMTGGSLGFILFMFTRLTVEVKDIIN